MKKLINLCIACIVLLSTSGSWAEVAVIVHPSCAAQTMTAEEVSRLFLGKDKSFPGGAQAVPVNQDEGQSPREKFNENVLKKSSSQYKAYWSQLLFTGKGTPPKDAGNNAAVKTLIAANPNMIGYVDASSVDASVKVIFKTP